MQELSKAKQEMVALRLEHQRLSTKLQEYSIFNKYLEKVVESSEVSGGGRPPQSHLLRPVGRVGDPAGHVLLSRCDASELGTPSKPGIHL